ncbi:MAG: YbaK/EbsC family protein [Candidatus Diapherotrites archaeon]
MLEDFIEVNKLKATIIEKAIFNSSSAKCVLLLREPTALKPFLVVHLKNTEISMEKVKNILPIAETKEANAKETYYITGYQKGYLPAISIYGVIVLLDIRAAKKKKLYILVGENRTLEISPAEIKKANEECIVCDIAR